MNTLEEAKSLKSYMINLRNYFHAYPELGLHEFNTCKKIQEELDKEGIKSCRVKDTNVIAELDTGKPGKTLFLRADIDALPIHEANDVPYKSQNDGVMHACGHDGHTAYMLGAARLIKKHLPELSGKIIIAFQAAEEIGRGARDIIAAGVLDKVDRCFGIHFQSGMDVGKIGIKSGADMASCDRFSIKITGKAGHITTPQKCVDSLFIAAQIATQLQTVVSRLISPVEGALIGIGKIQSGTTYNIIPGNAELEGTIRAFTDESRKKLYAAITKIAENVAEEYGGKANVFIEDICDACFNDEKATAEVVESCVKIIGRENTLTNMDKRFMSDNFADYFRKAPGCYAHVGSSDSEANSYPHHNEHFDLAEDSTVYAAALALQYTLDYLGDKTGEKSC